MCNAWNHYPDCTCGFGPPYAVSGKIILGKRDEWVRYATSSRLALKKGLEEGGFGAADIVKALDYYQDAIENKKDCNEDIKLIGPPSEVYELSEDHSGSITTIRKTWTYDSGYKVKIGVSAFKMKAFIEARIFRQRQLNLTFELPSGYDYTLFPLKNKNGIKWKVS